MDKILRQGGVQGGGGLGRHPQAPWALTRAGGRQGGLGGLMTTVGAHSRGHDHASHPSLDGHRGDGNLPPCAEGPETGPLQPLPTVVKPTQLTTDTPTQCLLGREGTRGVNSSPFLPQTGEKSSWGEGGAFFRRQGEHRVSLTHSGLPGPPSSMSPPSERCRSDPARPTLGTGSWVPSPGLPCPRRLRGARADPNLDPNTERTCLHLGWDLMDTCLGLSPPQRYSSWGLGAPGRPCWGGEGRQREPPRGGRRGCDGNPGVPSKAAAQPTGTRPQILPMPRQEPSRVMARVSVTLSRELNTPRRGAPGPAGPCPSRRGRDCPVCPPARTAGLQKLLDASVGPPTRRAYTRPHPSLGTWHGHAEVALSFPSSQSGRDGRQVNMVAREWAGAQRRHPARG